MFHVEQSGGFLGLMFQFFDLRALLIKEESNRGKDVENGIAKTNS
jgi:hypothetical protein